MEREMGCHERAGECCVCHGHSFCDSQLISNLQVLTVEIMDKDEGSVHDDYIGSFSTSVSPGAKEVEIVSTIRKAVKGTFWLNVSPYHTLFFLGKED